MSNGLKHKLMPAANILALIALGLVLQIGGAYLVNAAVTLLGQAAGADAASAGAKAAMEYSAYMDSIRAIEPRKFAHVLFVAPLIEEVVFRFLFLRAGKMVMPFWAANLVQAVLFGIYHTVMIQRVYGFVMGLIIGCVCHYCPIIYRKNVKNSDLPDTVLGVVITFVLHVVINATGLFLAPLLPADIAIPVQIGIGTLMMAVAAGVCLVLMRESAKAQCIVPGTEPVR